VASFPLQVRAQPMRSTEIKPSMRLRRAASAERVDIARQRERLHAKREALVAQLDEINASLATLDERDGLLGRLAPEGTSPSTAAANSAEPVHTHALQYPAAEVPNGAASNGDQTALRGPAIREVAVSLLAARRGTDALHYRAWFDLLTCAGYQVAGKDPLAVFLTQLSRSPLVHKSTQAGVYEIDRDAPHRLARQLSSLQIKLREATSAPSTADLGEIRTRREELVNSIRHAERALEEAERVLGADAAPAPTAVAIRAG
jgi:hypothetical protein